MCVAVAVAMYYVECKVSTVEISFAKCEMWNVKFGMWTSDDLYLYICTRTYSYNSNLHHPVHENCFILFFIFIFSVSVHVFIISLVPDLPLHSFVWLLWCLTQSLWQWETFIARDPWFHELNALPLAHCVASNVFGFGQNVKRMSSCKRNILYVTSSRPVPTTKTSTSLPFWLYVLAIHWLNRKAQHLKYQAPEPLSYAQRTAYTFEYTHDTTNLIFVQL